MHVYNVNIVVRTFNEERWLRSCLAKISEQSYKEFCVTVVDSGSDDKTLALASEFDSNLQLKIESITDYTPGKSLNVGVSAVESVYTVFLSAHCIPTSENWLEGLVQSIESNELLAGVYGRQLPMESTGADDRRDLLMTFGNEVVIQKRNPMFHNANSIVRTELVTECPFDSEIPHLEDRQWAQRMIERGFQIKYDPAPAVFHEHGLHQHGNKTSFRASGVGNVLTRLADMDVEGRHNIRNHGRKFEHALVLLNWESMAGIARARNLLTCSFARETEVYAIQRKAIAPTSRAHELFENRGAKFLGCEDLSSVQHDQNYSHLLSGVLNVIETDRRRYLDSIQILDLSYSNLLLETYEICAQRLYSKWASAVVPAWRDTGNYLFFKNELSVSPTSLSMERSSQREVMRVILGQGACFRADLIRLGAQVIDAAEVVYSSDLNILVKDD